MEKFWCAARASRFCIKFGKILVRAKHLASSAHSMGNTWLPSCRWCKAHSSWLHCRCRRLRLGLDPLPFDGGREAAGICIGRRGCRASSGVTDSSALLSAQHGLRAEEEYEKFVVE